MTSYPLLLPLEGLTLRLRRLKISSRPAYTGMSFVLFCFLEILDEEPLQMDKPKYD